MVVAGSRRFGSTLGLAASSSCQRVPLPRVCCASFQRESPGWTITVFSGEVAFAAGDGGAMDVTAFDLGADGAIAAALLGRDAGGAMREIEGGADGAARRVKGSTRRRGAELAIAGATTALGRAGTTFGGAGEEGGRGAASFGTEMTGAAKTGSSYGRWKVSGVCAARF